MVSAQRSLQENEELLETLRNELITFVDQGQMELAAARIELFHPADQAEVIEILPEAVRDRLLTTLSDEDIAEILDFLDEEPRERFVSRLDNAVLARILVFVDEVVAADIVEQLPDERVQPVLSQLANREEVSELLSLPEDCVARWMSSEVLSLRSDWTVQAAFEFLRKEKPNSGEHFYLYTVDEDQKLQGVVSIRDFITAPPEVLLRDIMVPDVIRVSQTTDQEQAADRLRHYGLLALPVVDETGALVGLLRADEVLNVQVEEATEDIYLQVGLGADASPFSPVMEAIKVRVPWLIINLLIGFFSAFIVSRFQATLEQAALLAAFMPIVAGHGGNAGSQTSTLVVRGLALNEISRRDVGTVWRKEASFGVIYGLLAGSLTAALAYAMSSNYGGSGQHSWHLALIVFLAMFGNVVMATLGGSMIPVLLKHFKVDPALASTVWLTTLTDWIGFLLLLGLASLWLKGGM
ncbi:magnesium transporter [bacterium]|nr:magnesium transporter [bacterium]